MDTIEAKATAVMERLCLRTANALRALRDESKPEMVRAVCAAYLDVHRHRTDYLRAAFQNENVRAYIEDDHRDFMKFDLAEFIVHVPAVWEFEFTKVMGDIADALWCIGQYGATRGGKPKWVRFIGVSPLGPTDPFNAIRVPILHKSNSVFRQGWENRNRLKAMLGNKYRKLVNDARRMTKKEFLEEFHKVRIPWEQRQAISYQYRSGRTQTVRFDGKQVKHIEPHKLLQLTGYTPEELWREADFIKRNRGQHVEPKKPQLELL